MTTANASNTSTNLCLTCGTRVSEDQTRCLVCGTDLNPSQPQKTTRTGKTVRGSRIPEVTLGLPMMIILFVVFLIFGGLLSYLAFGGEGDALADAQIGTSTQTAAPTLTSTPVTPTLTFTPQPSPTPFTYIVQPQDTCGEIGFAFNISVTSIILLNGLDANCSLTVGTELLIPHPTPTPTPVASSTLTGAEATFEACNTETYVVQAGETLSLIALIYSIEEQSILDWNGLTTSQVFSGQRLVIPLCEVLSVFGVGTVTPSPAPPYPAPELLLPLNGEYFSLNDDSVVLQWSSIGTLRDNEVYQVTIINVTDGETVLVEEVLDTRFIVPESMRPNGNEPHIFLWYVVPVAQIGTDEEGDPIWMPGGPVSVERVFSWSGAVTQ